MATTHEIQTGTHEIQPGQTREPGKLLHITPGPHGDARPHAQTELRS